MEQRTTYHLTEADAEERLNAFMREYGSIPYCGSAEIRPAKLEGNLDGFELKTKHYGSD